MKLSYDEYETIHTSTHSDYVYVVYRAEKIYNSFITKDSIASFESTQMKHAKRFKKLSSAEALAAELNVMKSTKGAWTVGRIRIEEKLVGFNRHWGTSYK